MAKLLIVDDDPDASETVVKAMQKAGHHAYGVANGRSALNSVLNNTPDLVVLDLLMPEMNGIGFLEIIRSYLRLESLPVIVLSALSDGPMIDRARALQVKTILVKARSTFAELADAVNVELNQASASVNSN